MLKRTLLIISGVLVLAGFGLATAPSAFASASTDAAKLSECEAISGTMKDGVCTTETASLNHVIANIVNFLSLLIGVIAVIMIMIGGFKYITANGDSGNISSAKNTIIYALVGLVISAFAQVIVKFVLQKTIK